MRLHPISVLLTLVLLSALNARASGGETGLRAISDCCVLTTAPQRLGNAWCFLEELLQED